MPLLVVEVMARNDRPPSLREAPYTKSCWPPMPENMRVPIESAHIWPVRSISRHELIAITFGFWAMMKGSFVHATSLKIMSRL